MARLFLDFLGGGTVGAAALSTCRSVARPLNAVGKRMGLHRLISVPSVRIAAIGCDFARDTSATTEKGASTSMPAGGSGELPYALFRFAQYDRHHET